MESAPREPLVRSTLAALAAPRRLVPILIVALPLIGFQTRTSRDHRAFALGVAMCSAFVLIAPLAWRWLFGDGEGESRERDPARALAYSAIALAVIFVLGVVIPRSLAMTWTVLTSPWSLVVATALFVVGGWGLGRDIELERNLVRARARADLLARDAEHAQLLALRSHLDPHFLFNTLNAIAEWCREDGEVAERAVLQLAEILRAVLAGVKDPTWPLATELGLVRDLFALHLLRDPSLFALAWDVPDNLPSVSVPPMVLFPIAENAVKHGPSAGHRGELSLRVEARDGVVRIAIENPGAYAGPRAGGSGLPTARRRLELAYGGRATMAITPHDDRTRVLLELPASGPLRGVNV